MSIEYDPAKREQTLRARRLDMARANEIFGGETRRITIGFLDGRMVVVAWTTRASSRRIISLRKANGRKQKKYGPRFSR